MNKHRFTPLLIAIGTIAGIFIGSFYTKHFSGGRINIINTGTSKVGYLLQLIDNNYVDTVDMNTLIEDAMPQILKELDPHSGYFGPKEAEESVEDLRGSFSGIGVQFTMEQDTVNVMSVIHGGPSERVGIPVIASGGAGALEHFYDAFTEGKADAVLAASLFHFGEIPIPQLKEYLNEKGIPVRI